MNMFQKKDAKFVDCENKSGSKSVICLLYPTVGVNAHVCSVPEVVAHGPPFNFVFREVRWLQTKSIHPKEIARLVGF